MHWPLVVWFGDSQLNTVHSEDTWGGRQPGIGPLVRDLTIAIASCVITWVSFFWLEMPVMKAGANVPPSKVIGIGFASATAIAGAVLIVTHQQTGSSDSQWTDGSTAEDRTLAFETALKRQTPPATHMDWERVCAHCAGCSAWPVISTETSAAACAATVLAADRSICSHTHFTFAEIGNGTCACAPQASSFHCDENNSEWAAFYDNSDGNRFGYSLTVFTFKNDAAGAGGGESLLLLGDSLLKFLYINPWRDIAKAHTSPRLSSSMPQCRGQPDSPAWFRRMLPGFVNGMPVVQLFGSDECTWCPTSTYPPNCAWDSANGCSQQSTATRLMADLKREIAQRIRQARARNVLLLESHFMRGWVDLKRSRYGMFQMEDALDDALRNLLLHLAEHGAKHVFMAVPMQGATTRKTHAFFGNLTLSDGNTEESDSFLRPRKQVPLLAVGALQRAAWMSMVERHSCEFVRGPTQRLHVSILDYHTVYCPGFNRPGDYKQQARRNKRYPNTTWPLGVTGYCSTERPVRGFAEGVGGVHPGHGPMFEWLGAQLQLMVKIGRSREAAGDAKLPPADSETECLQAAYPWGAHNGTCPSDFKSQDSTTKLSCSPTTQTLESMVTTAEICISGASTMSTAW